MEMWVEYSSGYSLDMDLPNKNADPSWPRGFVKTEFCEGKKKRDLWWNIF